MKRVVVLAIAMMLIALLVPALAVADSAASQTGTVSVGSSFAWVRSGPGTQYKAVGRLYTGNTVTILETVRGQTVYSGNPNWYRIGDGRFIYSALVKVSSAPPPSPPKPNPQPGGEKWIEIDLSEHKLIAWEGNRVVLTTIVAIGKPSTPTVKGTFRIYSKYLYKDMSGPGYYQPRVPHTMFFYGGYAIHGTYWHNRFGQNVSHGCVNVNLTDAATLYNWAPVGTKVVIHD